MPGGYSFDKLRDLVSSRLELAPIFRRRLVEVPLRLSHPYWVDDPSFDIEYHIRRGAVPAPGGVEELAQFVGDVCSRQLDRTKPLWEMYIVEGLRGGQIGLVTKIHHCTIDGVSGAELLSQLFDLEPNPPARPAPEGPVSVDTHLPSDLQLLAKSIGTRVTRPVGMTKLAWKTGWALLDVRRVRARGSGRAALPLTTPRTSLNASITPHRRVAFSSIGLEDAKRIKRACHTTLNDVVLAVCTGALRRYLIEGNELPDEPLVATVPVSTAPRAGKPPRRQQSVGHVRSPAVPDRRPRRKAPRHPGGHQGSQAGAQRPGRGRAAQLDRARHPERVLGRGPAPTAA